MSNNKYEPLIHMNNRNVRIAAGTGASLARSRRRRMKYILPPLFAGLFVGFLLYLHQQQQPQPDPLWEEPSLLDIEFHWLAKNEGICKRNRNASRILPILIHSSRNHFIERNSIRRTWGFMSNYKDWDIRLIFLLGDSPARKENKALQAEQTKFGDLVIGNFSDTYRNLSYKHLMGYKWILNYCREAPFVLKVDDDIFIDIMLFIDWLSSDLRQLAAHETLPDIRCKTFTKPTPYRYNESKWFVTQEEWSEPLYPQYCLGWVYSIRTDILEKIYAVSNDVKAFWIDDVFATGILRERAEKRFHMKTEMHYIRVEELGRKEDPCNSGTFEGPRKDMDIVGFPVSRGKHFEKDSLCYWNRTLELH